MSQPNNINNQLTQLEFQTDLQRKSSFLKPLALGLVFIHLIALIAQVSSGGTTSSEYATNGLGLFLYSSVLYLNRRGRIQLAANIFCYTFDLLLLYLYLVNLLVHNDPVGSTLFAYMLGIGILLAGSLINSTASLWFFGLNVGVVIISFAWATKNIESIIAFCVPIFAFLFLLTLISWLYQKTLTQAQDSLNTARRELNQTALMQRDISIARDLQEQLYPQPPAIQNGVRFTSQLQAARETSGDFYDFVPLDSGRIGIVMADVTGKSLAAAMLMTMTRSILRNEARRSSSPAEVLAHANETLLEDVAVEQMVTAFYGVLDTANHTLRYANAGQLYPLLKRDGQIEEIQINGFPIGSVYEAEYTNYSLKLLPGDHLVIYTDGICEAMDTHRKMFGFERVQDALLAANGGGPDTILNTVWQRVEDFRGGAEQSDDMAMIIISIEAE